MSKEVLDQAISQGNATLAAWDTLLEELASIKGPNGEEFDLNLVVPGLKPAESINSLGRQIRAAVEVTTSLSDIDTLTGVPRTHIVNLNSRVGELHTHIDACKSAVDGFRSKGAVTSLDSTNFTSQNAANEPLNLPPLLQKANDPIDNVLNLAQLIRVFTASEAELGQSIDLVADAREKQAHALSNIGEGLRKLEEAQRKVDAAMSAVSGSAKNAKGAEDAAATAKAAVEEALTQARNALQETQKTEQEASKLKATVEAYQTTFDTFQSQLDARNGEFETGKKAQQDFLSKLDNQTAEAERLQEKSRAVMGEATVAGLSQHFLEEARSTGKRLLLAQILLVASVIFFAVSAGMTLNIPVLHGLGLTPAALKMSTEGSGNGNVLYQLLASSFGKLVFLAPSAFLVVFTAKRAADLFRLRAEYTYKFTVAASLPGFKEESPEYAEAINAAAFKELLFNPAADEGDGVKKEGSWFSRLLEPGITKAVERAMERLKPPS